jgi:hypothetical protein
VENDTKFYIKKSSQKEIADWWKDILTNSQLKNYIESKYALENRKMDQDDIVGDEN